MTPEVASLVAGAADDWFQRARRALADLEFKLERRTREISVREQELETRARDLGARGEQLREAYQKAGEASQDLMARTHRLREEEQGLARDRESVTSEREALARARDELDARRAELAEQERGLAELDRTLKVREEAVAQWEAEIRALRAKQEDALGVFRDALKQDLELNAPAPGVPATPEVPPEAQERSHVVRLLELEVALQTAAEQLRSRQGEAERILAEATDRAAQVQSIDARIQEHEERLEAMRLEIVNARRALLVVDDALAHMPYEVVDDFTKSEAFEAYERAVRDLKRFEERSRPA